ncbi:hypothetical protein B4065_0795 [Caldibacillus thermoamylovorans]|nr:hypothetical protein B4065_0795 [Caldibacillus thermoamylovorans]
MMEVSPYKITFQSVGLYSPLILLFNGSTFCWKRAKKPVLCSGYDEMILCGKIEHVSFQIIYDRINEREQLYSYL